MTLLLSNQTNFGRIAVTVRQKAKKGKSEKTACLIEKIHKIEETKHWEYEYQQYGDELSSNWRRTSRFAETGSLRPK